MVVGLLGNKSPDSNRFTLVTPKPENGVRLQATLGNQNPTSLSVGAVSVVLYIWYKKEREARDKCTAEVEGTIRFVNRYTKTYQWSGESNIERTAVLYRPMFGYQYNGETYAEFPAFDSGIDDEKYYVVGNRYELPPPTLHRKWFRSCLMALTRHVHRASTPSSKTLRHT